MRKYVVGLLLSFLVLFSGVSSAITYEYSINQRTPQTTLYYCGPAVAQNWIRALTGSYYDQAIVASPVIVNWFSGTNAGEMATMMNNLAGYTVGYSRVFYYSNLPNQDQAEGGVAVNLSYGSRVAIAANTLHPNGNIKGVGSHWLLIYGAAVVNNYDLSWVKMFDPLENSSYAGNYEVVPYGRSVTKSDLFSKHWSNLSHGARQYVVHTN